MLRRVPNTPTARLSRTSLQLIATARPCAPRRTYIPAGIKKPAFSHAKAGAVALAVFLSARKLKSNRRCFVA